MPDIITDPSLDASQKVVKLISANIVDIAKSKMLIFSRIGTSIQKFPYGNLLWEIFENWRSFFRTLIN